MFNLTPNAALLSLAMEGPFKPKAWLDTVANPPVWTIAQGLTKLQREDGWWRPVTPDDRIEEGDAEFQLHQYFRENIEPVLAKTFEDVELQPHQRDALASMVYNMGPPAKFPKTTALIQLGATIPEILDEWVNGEWNGALGLYRRRLMEAIVFGYGWDWENAHAAAMTANWSTNWRDLVGFEQEAKPVAFDDEIFDEVAKGRGSDMKREEGSDPTPEDGKVTMEDAMFLSAEAAGYEGTYADFIAHRTVVTQRNAIEAPKVDTKKPPKPMEDSKTHRGLSKKDSGKEGVQMGAVLTGAATTMGTVRELTRDTAATAESAGPLVGGFTANHLILVGLFIGVPLLIWGAWRMMRGEMIAREGRQEGTQLKV